MAGMHELKYPPINCLAVSMHDTTETTAVNAGNISALCSRASPEAVHAESAVRQHGDRASHLWFA